MGNEDGLDNTLNENNSSEYTAEEAIVNGIMEAEDIVVSEVKQPHVKAKRGSRLQHKSAAVKKERSKQNKTLSSPHPLCPTVTLTIEDECDVIAKHVAIQLRKLPAEDLIDANLEIQQVLAKYRKRNTPSRPSFSAADHQSSSVHSDT